MTQPARNLNFDLAEQGRPTKFLIRDRDAKFTASFDEEFATEGTRVIATSIRSPGRMGVTRAVRRGHPPGVSRSLAGLPSRPAQYGPQRIHIHRPPQRTSPIAARLVGRPRSPTSRETVAYRRSGASPVAPARQARRFRSRLPTRGVGCSDGFLGTCRMFGSQRWDHDSGTPFLRAPKRRDHSAFRSFSGTCPREESLGQAEGGS